MVQDTCASRLLGIDGLTVSEVEDAADGTRLVYASTSPTLAPICPSWYAVGEPEVLGRYHPA